MTSVLGYHLDEAIAILKGEGYAVTTVEVSAKKRIDDGTPRVIKQTLDGNTVELSYSLFMDS